MALHPGLLIGDRYLLAQQIAVGGMGEVWEAADQLLGRQVAVKLLRSEFGGDKEFIDRFRVEARTAGVINHRNIAAVHDYGEDAAAPDGATAYLVMELVHGEPLSSRLSAKGKLEPAETLALLEQAGRALQAAHEHGFVHRDVKPGNILLSSEEDTAEEDTAEDGTARSESTSAGGGLLGPVKLTDFGIAKAANTSGLTEGGLVLGTAHYIAPEQAVGEDAGPASDVYSLGVVGYECLAGHRPYHADSSADVAAMHVNDPLPPLPGDIPPQIRKLIEYALVKNPNNRYRDGTEFTAAVAAVRRGRPAPRPGSLTEADMRLLTSRAQIPTLGPVAGGGAAGAGVTGAGGGLAGAGPAGADRAGAGSAAADSAGAAGAAARRRPTPRPNTPHPTPTPRPTPRPGAGSAPRVPDAERGAPRNTPRPTPTPRPAPTPKAGSSPPPPDADRGAPRNTPRPTPTPKPSPSPKPTPSPKPAATSKPVPKPSPGPTAKPTPTPRSKPSKPAPKPIPTGQRPKPSPIPKPSPRVTPSVAAAPGTSGKPDGPTPGPDTGTPTPGTPTSAAGPNDEPAAGPTRAPGTADPATAGQSGEPGTAGPTGEPGTAGPGATTPGTTAPTAEPAVTQHAGAESGAPQPAGAQSGEVQSGEVQSGASTPSAADAGAGATAGKGATAGADPAAGHRPSAAKKAGTAAAPSGIAAANADTASALSGTAAANADTASAPSGTAAAAASGADGGDPDAPGGTGGDTGSPTEQPSAPAEGTPPDTNPPAKGTPLPGGLRPMGAPVVGAESATLRMDQPRSPWPGVPRPDLGERPESAPHTPVPGPTSGAASRGLSAPGMPQRPGTGGGGPQGQWQAGPQPDRPVGRPAVDTTRERSGITPLTWAFILLTIAAIVLGVIVVRNALLATQPGVGPGPTGMERPGEVEPTSVPVALRTPLKLEHGRGRIRWLPPAGPVSGGPSGCSVTDLTSHGKAPGASGGSTPCPLR